VKRPGLVLAAIVLGVAIGGWSPMAAAGSEPRVYVVSPQGDDRNPGNFRDPWRTFDASLPKLECGDTLLARGGSYVENATGMVLQACPASSPIQVQGYADERPVIVGLLWLDRPSHWTFDGINVTWSPSNLPTQHMVKVINGVGWVFKNAELWGAESYANLLVVSTMAGEPADWTVAYNCIHDNYGANDNVNGEQLVYVNTHDTPGGVVSRNILFNAANGMGVKLGGASEGEDGPSGVVVRYNTIYNTTQNVFVAWSAKDNEIYRNILGKVDLDLSDAYGNIRGFELTGRGNVAHDNVGFLANSLIYNDPGYVGVQDAGSNLFPLNPMFDAKSCQGFDPRNPLAEEYGRYAP
jgi:hypothetical protein